MLYSQAVTGSQAPAPSATSASPASTNTTTPHSDKPTARTSGGTKQAHTNTKLTTRNNHNGRPLSPKRRHHHSPNPDHKPNTTSPEQAVYVLTLTTTPSLTDPLTALRRSHFPRHLDRHPAHLTLFHALPGSELQAIAAALAELCAAQPPLRLATGRIFRMRRGVGINLADGGGAQAGGGKGGRRSSSKAAGRRLHGELQRRWWGFLSEQDRRPWIPHWTVQNKAADDGAVDAALEEVRKGFRGAEGLATGCALWRYEKGGNWAFERDFHFDGDEQGAC